LASASALPDLHSLATCHAKGTRAVRESVAHARALALDDTHHAWIHVLTDAELAPHLERLEARGDAPLPLLGVPFAIKDNIDLAGIPTTAACPEFQYVPDESAPVVQALLDAGAVPIGKTNMDQFATGLVGVRSPYGETRNAIDPEWIAGGSSSGSAVAVALGQVCFALGTDTAGSGRVPAAFNNIYGHKPTRGWLSTRGVVPACRSLDCVSVFSRTPAEAADILGIAGRFDPQDAYARRLPSAPAPPRSATPFRFAIPQAAALDSFVEAEYARMFGETVDVLREAGGEAEVVDIDFLLEAARLLYEGPWVAERLASLGEILDARPQILHPTTLRVLSGGRDQSAADAFRARHRLAAHALEARRLFKAFEFLLLPTAPAIYRREALDQDPIGPNAHLGTYTNFMNLLDLCGAASPAGRRADGLPFGVTLVAPAGHDARVLARAELIQRRRNSTCGADLRLPVERAVEAHGGPWIDLAVCGAHLAGEPLNTQLTERGGVLLERTETAENYRLYVLPEGPVRRPALVRCPAGERGDTIEIEIWRLPSESLGSFLAGIAAPLGLGQVETRRGVFVTGFICEQEGIVGAQEITRFGGWRNWQAATSTSTSTSAKV
jgi:allophanate hydrolase